jgi:hypothetical protein
MAGREGHDGTATGHRPLSPSLLEAQLLDRFTAHRVFQDLDSLPGVSFLELLLQRRFLSLAFPVIYDIAIDGLTDPAAVTLVREILREEYPDPSGRTPSHREDLVGDLLTLGATRAEIHGSRPNPATTTVIEGALRLITGAAARASDLELLTILRFWGEVLVSVEYGEYWRRMDSAFAAASIPSRFYAPHHHHDGSDPLTSDADGSTTHSGRLGACLLRLLVDEPAADRFAEAEHRTLALRLDFYDQF